jgi:hypothetical protein
MATISLNYVYKHDIYRECTLDVSEILRYVLRRLLKNLSQTNRPIYKFHLRHSHNPCGSLHKSDFRIDRFRRGLKELKKINKTLLYQIS